MRRALRSGLEGNLLATRFIIDRVCGKAQDAPAECPPIDIELPDLGTTASCLAALDVVTKAIVDGTSDRGTAKLLLDAILVRVKAIEANELEQRLAELEKATQSVEGVRSSRGP